MTAERLACVLCGSETERTVMTLVEWTEPVAGETWSTVPRCVDRPACRRRVQHVLGEPWPVNDRTPEPELPPQPVAAPKPAPADAPKEVLPWLRG